MTLSSLSELPLDFLSVQSFLIFAAVLLIIHYLLTREKWTNLPPGPSSLPLIGNVHKLGGEQMHVVTAKMSEEFGAGLMTINLAGTKAVMLTSLKAVQEAFVEKSHLFADRYQFRILDYILGNEGSMIMENGEKWKSSRRATLTGLHNFGMGKRSLENKINEEARYLSRCFEKENNRPFNPEHNIQCAVANVICSISLGNRYDYDDPEFSQILELIKILTEKTSASSPLGVIPKLWFTPLFAKMRKTRDDFVSILRGAVEQHKETFDSNDIRDIIDVHLQNDMESDGIRETLPQNLIWRNIGDLIFGGTDTTTQNILWAILLLTQYPRVQEKVQQEIDDVIGKERPPTSLDRLHMPYVDATLMEMVRFRSTATFTFPRTSPVYTELMGYTIPKGMQVWTNLYAILHSPEHWTNPDEFIPERFLTEDGKGTEKPEAFIPFGIGRRVCIGQQIARMESFLFLTNILQRFTLKIPQEDPKPSLEGINGLTFSPGQFRVCAVSR